jgi:hypothetical protein
VTGGDIPISWDEWDKKIKSPGSLWETFSRGTIPPTQDMKFKMAVYELVELLLEEKNLLRFLSLLAFLKDHPKMNEILLKYAAMGADLRGDYTSRILVSPIEVRLQIIIKTE